MENFDTDLDAAGVTRMVSANSRFKVVGVTFLPDYPDNILALNLVLEERRALIHYAEGVTVVLIRNPENEYDSNAIEVHVPSLGMIGHVPRDLAAALAPRLDAGEQVSAAVVDVLISPEHIDRPGITVQYNFPFEGTNQEPLP